MIAGFIIYDCLLITERLCRLCVCVQCGGKLSRHLEGPAYDVFARTLRGLADSKITKPGQFRTEDGSGSAVRCSLKVLSCLLSLSTSEKAAITWWKATCLGPVQNTTTST